MNTFLRTFVDTSNFPIIQAVLAHLFVFTYFSIIQNFKIILIRYFPKARINTGFFASFVPNVLLTALFCRVRDCSIKDFRAALFYDIIHFSSRKYLFVISHLIITYNEKKRRLHLHRKRRFSLIRILLDIR